MLGLVFTELVKMLDEVHSPRVCEEIILSAKLPSGGAYTAFGSYADEELHQLVSSASAVLEIEPDTMLHQLGEFMVADLAERYTSHFQASREPFEFLVATNRRLQHEARKLYRDEDLPVFSTQQVGADTLVLECASHHRFGGILLGGVFGVLDYYEMDADVVREVIREGGNECLRFTLSRRVMAA